jgi:hypothetical protein
MTMVDESKSQIPPSSVTNHRDSDDYKPGDDHRHQRPVQQPTGIPPNSHGSTGSTSPHPLHHDGTTATTTTYLYASPHQRQRWGDTQITPHTNWGDLFFDVFYVAAAYNLGNVLKDTPSQHGLLVVAGMFFPVMNLWSLKVYYDARFYYVNDYYHRFYEIFLLCAIATMILHIRSYDIVSHPNQYPDMFIFCLSGTVAFLLTAGRFIEIIIGYTFFKRHATGLHLEAYNTARRDILGMIVPIACLVAASIQSGYQYFTAAITEDSYSTTKSSQYNETEYSNTTTVLGEEHRRRILAESSTSSYAKSDVPNHVAIWLLLGAVFAMIAWFMGMVLYYSLNKDNKQ